MSKGNTFENDFLKLIFQGVPIANLADDAASAPLTDLYVSLHSADPGEAGDQTTNEVSYTGYARINVSRSVGGWAVLDNSVKNNVNINFAQCTGGTDTATYVSVGTASSGGGKLLYSGALGAALSISPGIVPAFAVGALTITED